MSASNRRTLLSGVGQLVEGVGEFDAAGVELEALRDARVEGVRPRQRRLARRIGVKDGRPADPEARLDPLAQDPAEHVRPGVVRGDPQARVLRLTGEQRHVRRAPERQAVIEVDPGMAQKRLAHAQPLGRLERARLAAAEGEARRARHIGGERDERSAVVHQLQERRADPIPFQHREFRRVQSSALAVAKHMRQRENLRLAGGEQLLHRKFRRGVQPGLARRAVRTDKPGAKPAQMGLVARRGLERGRLDLEEAFGVEPLAHGGRDRAARISSRGRRTACRSGFQNGGGAEGLKGLRCVRRIAGRSRLAFAAETSIKRADAAGTSPQSARSVRAACGATNVLRTKFVRVIASSIRKGNIIEREDGQLCVVLSAESFHPGKGTPTTQIDMRRLSDGVKVTDRFKTTEQVERAFVEDKEFDFLYADGDGSPFHEH